jgi:uncharacterized lipoprotein
MKAATGALLLLLAGLVAPGTAAEEVSQTFAAPVDRVWAVTEAVLNQLGWKIDKTDRSIGWITTESRWVEGEEYGVYAKGTRHRLRVMMRAAGERSTSVSVERSVFKRERILFVNNDTPLTVTDRNVEKALLAAIGKAL